ncbi:MAG: 4-(cytidine 5'-diphospho)-2-C-methyl-D-erythritol kinase [Paracoccaceae bacterium]|nr:4-(cytidine 5'-diphospho)-2-C-methyl-D-erythritol kinase [Paracoccaceae bacterium]
MIECCAPAKINLALHVTGRRADGYHLLDSLVVFADHGDLLHLSRASELSLTIGGPMGAGLTAGADNLVLQAARLILPPDKGARITLEKNLPVAAGIGGGSSDAAACLRALADLYDLPMPSAHSILMLGADLPVCLLGRAARLEGIGERLTPLAPLPDLPAVLVNPMEGVSTGQVFHRLDRVDNPPLSPLPEGADLAGWLDWLADQRNDLQGPALAVAPVIGQVLAAIQDTQGCRLARMSGSGATCFGLFGSDAQAQAGADSIAARNPGWWVRKVVLRGGQETRETT